MMHKIPIKIIYLTESLVNLSSSGFGYKIALIKLPLKVLNPVWNTIPKGFPFPIFLFWTTFVPPNKIYLSLSGSFVLKTLSVPAILTFITGVLSPVSIDSFIITLPSIKMVSHGIANPSSGISNKSPGTNSVESISTASINSFFSFFL